MKPLSGGDGWAGRRDLCYAGATSFDNDTKISRQIPVPAEAHLTESAKGLVRTIGRWSLAALMVNTMIGASIFGLPALIAARLGKWSPVGFLVAFAGISVIAACMAEVASQFREAGGPYLYSRTAFGPFFAIPKGWLTWPSRLAPGSPGFKPFIPKLG